MLTNQFVSEKLRHPVGDAEREKIDRLDPADAEIADVASRSPRRRGIVRGGGVCSHSRRDLVYRIVEGGMDLIADFIGVAVDVPPKRHMNCDPSTSRYRVTNGGSLKNDIAWLNVVLDVSPKCRHLYVLPGFVWINADYG